jgi:hypothetical protein
MLKKLCQNVCTISVAIYGLRVTERGVELLQSPSNQTTGRQNWDDVNISYVRKMCEVIELSLIRGWSDSSVGKKGCCLQCGVYIMENNYLQKIPLYLYIHTYIYVCVLL